MVLLSTVHNCLLSFVLFCIICINIIIFIIIIKINVFLNSSAGFFFFFFIYIGVFIFTPFFVYSLEYVILANGWCLYLQKHCGQDFTPCAPFSFHGKHDPVPDITRQ